MKFVPALLVCSLAVNAALLTAVVFRPELLHLSWGSGPHAAAGSMPLDSRTPLFSRASETPRVWTQLSSGDLPSIRDRLKAAGFPPEVIRAVIQALVAKEYEVRRAALLSAEGPKPYWKKNGWAGLDPKTSKEWNALNREQSAALKTLLGQDYMVSNAIYQYLQKETYGDLAQAKIDQIQRIQQDYGDLSGEIYANANGTLLPEDEEKLAYLRQQQEADIEHAMSPEEYALYQLRSSPTAQALKMKLSAFNPSEAEYRTLFALQQAFDKQYTSPFGGAPTADQAAERAAAEKTLETQIASALGPDRYADYQLVTDPAFSQTDRLVQRLGLPDGTTTQVIAVQKAIQAQASSVRSNSALSAAEKSAELSALADQATSQLTPLLGDQGMKAYGNHGGSWLASLKPPLK